MHALITIILQEFKLTLFSFAHDICTPVCLLPFVHAFIIVLLVTSIMHSTVDFKSRTKAPDILTTAIEAASNAGAFDDMELESEDDSIYGPDLNKNVQLGDTLTTAIESASDGRTNQDENALFIKFVSIQWTP